MWFIVISPGHAKIDDGIAMISKRINHQKMCISVLCSIVDDDDNDDVTVDG